MAAVAIATICIVNPLTANASESKSIGTAYGEATLALLPANAVPDIEASLAPSIVRMSSDCVAVDTENKDAITVLKGSILLQPVANLIVTAPHTKLRLAAGSVVLIDVHNKRTNVLNLHDRSLGDVQVYVGKYKTNLLPGNGIACGVTQTFERALSTDGLARRRVVEQQCDGKTAVSYEFSPVQAFSASDLLKDAQKSNEKKARKVMSKLIKTAAILATVTASHGAYQAAASR